MELPLSMSKGISAMARRTDEQRDASTPDGANGSSPGAGALGSFIRAQRQLADLSLRQLASLSNVSNAYLSQVERGLHQPSFKVVSSIAEALNLSTEYLLSQSGWLRPAEDGEREATGVEASVLADPLLTDEEKQVVIGVYRSLRRRHLES